MEKNCKWCDKEGSCWYWMPDSKLPCSKCSNYEEETEVKTYEALDLVYTEEAPRWQPVKSVLKIKRIDERAILPEIREGNAGIDLRVLTENGEPDVVIQPHSFFKFRTGIKMEIPTGYYIEIVPRSSTGCKKNISLKNTVGVIDSSYRGEVLVFVHNFGTEPVIILDNERLCQMIIHKDETVNFEIEEVNELSDTERGEGGFGSTGVK